jgi:hypothetical protein
MRQKVPNIYKNEIFKIRLTRGFIEVHEETGEERWVKLEEGIIGLNKFDGFEIMKKWVDMYYSPNLNVWGGHTIDDPKELYDLAKSLWDKENVTEFTPNKSMTINILEHPGDGRECELTAKVISINFGHKISKEDGEALAQL